MTAEALLETIARCSENLASHGRHLRVNLRGAASEEDLAKASLAIGLPINGSYRQFLQLHNGMRLDVERPGKPSNDMLQILSTDEAVQATTYLNGEIVEAYEDAGGGRFLRRYIVCARLMNADVMLDVADPANCMLEEPPIVMNLPGDVWMRRTAFPHVAPSFEAWLTASLESMATTSFGFDYEAEIAKWWRAHTTVFMSLPKMLRRVDDC